MKAQVLAIYNGHHLQLLYSYMIDNSLDSCIDTVDKVWYKEEVKNILINDYGWELSA